MKLKDLKIKLNKLTEKQLEQEAIYHSKQLSVSGTISGLVYQKGNLFNDYSDDPNTLLTLKELNEIYDKEEIEEMEIAIPKGAFVIEF